MQLGFFGVGAASIDQSSPSERTELGHGAWVEVHRGWLLGADTLCEELVGAVPWRHNRRLMYDRVVDEPRLSRWYGAGDDLPCPALEMVGVQLAQLHGVTLIGPVLNYYRDGRDSVAFHADRELRYLDNTIVAIVTLGASRPFLVRPSAAAARAISALVLATCWSWEEPANSFSSMGCRRWRHRAHVSARPGAGRPDRGCAPWATEVRGRALARGMESEAIMSNVDTLDDISRVECSDAGTVEIGLVGAPHMGQLFSIFADIVARGEGFPQQPPLTRSVWQRTSRRSAGPRCHYLLEGGVTKPIGRKLSPVPVPVVGDRGCLQRQHDVDACAAAGRGRDDVDAATV